MFVQHHVLPYETRHFKGGMAVDDTLS
jgi:hypothetical protein